MSELYRYGSTGYGALPYGGLSPQVIVPTRDPSGIIFLTANDRYQVISCSFGGDVSNPPQFRYWYANAPGWAENLNNDQDLPDWYTTDEDSIPTSGTLELAFKAAPNNQEMLVKNVTVEFVPRPSALTSETLDADTTLGFSCRVEAQGVPEYVRTADITRTTGMVTTDTYTFSELASEQSATIWPNIRTVTFPCRLTQRVVAARVVLTDITMCEILSVTLMGDTNVPARDR